VLHLQGMIMASVPGTWVNVVSREEAAASSIWTMEIGINKHVDS